MDVHVYKECPEYVVQCRGGCEQYYKRKVAETHQCIPKEDNSLMMIQERFKDIKNMNLKLEMDCK